TFALLTTALVVAAERPWWSVVAIGFAAAQNSFLALGIPIVAAAAIRARPALVRDARLWAGIACGGTVAAMEPVYSLWALGVSEPQALIGGVRFRIPTVEEAGLLLWDPNIGLVDAFPVLLLVVAIAGAWLVQRAPTRLRSPWPWAMGALTLLILFSAAQ